MDTTASLSFQSNSVTLRFGDASLAAGVGVHALRIPVTSEARWLDPDRPDDTAVMLLQAQVWLAPTHAVGSFDPQPVTLRGFPVSDDWTLHISDDQLWALDKARGQGDLLLTLQVQATLLGAPPGVHPVQTTQVSYRIPAAGWLSMLDQVGAHVAFSIRVPSPFTSATTSEVGEAASQQQPGLARASRHLRAARDHLRDGRPRSCVADCRLALETLDELMPTPAVGTTPSSRGQAERWAALQKALYSLASAAVHEDEVTRSFIWSRADAEAVLVTTAGLVARFRA